MTVIVPYQDAKEKAGVHAPLSGALSASRESPVCTHAPPRAWDAPGRPSRTRVERASGKALERQCARRSGSRVRCALVTPCRSAASRPTVPLLCPFSSSAAWGGGRRQRRAAEKLEFAFGCVASSSDVSHESDPFSIDPPPVSNAAGWMEKAGCTGAEMNSHGTFFFPPRGWHRENPLTGPSTRSGPRSTPRGQEETRGDDARGDQRRDEEVAPTQEGDRHEGESQSPGDKA